MARPLLLLAALVPLALGAVVLPALAQRSGAAAPGDPAAIDLQAIPVQPVTGPLSVRGIARDDEDESPALGRSGGQQDGEVREAETERHRGEADGDLDD